MSTVSGTRAAGKKLLVLGGTGFVGNTLVKKAVQASYQVVSMSRRGALDGQNDSGVSWVRGDATDSADIKRVVAEHGPFDACVHAVGVLFDGQSGLKQFNTFVSGSKSQVDDSATYDKITRQTAFNAVDAIINQKQVHPDAAERVPFVFVSAAEAAWTFKAPVDFLQRYLVAKREVEHKLMESSAELRPVIMRPSLIWSWTKPEKVFATIPFFVGSAIGLPFVDRPVQVEALTDAILRAVESEDEQGVQNFKEIERLAAERKRS
jgi:nucleoside-diphosphate-sugar epimerase